MITTLLLADKMEVNNFLVKVVLPIPDVPFTNILKLVRLEWDISNNLKLIGILVLSVKPNNKLLLSLWFSLSNGHPNDKFIEVIW